MENPQKRYNLFDCCTDKILEMSKFFFCKAPCSLVHSILSFFQLATFTDLLQERSSSGLLRAIRRNSLKPRRYITCELGIEVLSIHLLIHYQIHGSWIQHNLLSLLNCIQNIKRQSGKRQVSVLSLLVFSGNWSSMLMILLANKRVKLNQ